MLAAWSGSDEYSPGVRHDTSLNVMVIDEQNTHVLDAAHPIYSLLLVEALTA
jgi:hypothetical protein